MSISRTVAILACVPLFVAPAFAQSPGQTHASTRARVGVLASALDRYGEAIDGANGAFGGWTDITFGPWALNVDVSRSRRLSTRFDACLDTICSTSASATEIERNWAVGIAALRRVRERGPGHPYVLVGWGVSTRQLSHRFDDTSLEQESWSTWSGWGPVGGL